MTIKDETEYDRVIAIMLSERDVVFAQYTAAVNMGWIPTTLKFSDFVTMVAESHVKQENHRFWENLNDPCNFDPTWMEVLEY